MVKRYFRIGSIITLTAALTLFASGCSQKTAMVDEADNSAAKDTAASQDNKKMQSDGASSAMAPAGSEESLDTPASQNRMNFTILEGRLTGPMLPVYFDFDRERALLLDR